MRDELRERLANAMWPNAGYPSGTAPWAIQKAEQALDELEAFMREHDPPLKMMAAPKDWIYPANVWWDALPLTPWEGEDG